MTEELAAKLQMLPELPGVYLMKDAKGKIIYVGKAIVLKNRVRQYFQSSKNHSPKVRAMVANIADLDTIIVASEVEALILECNLIKKHHPRYNISLKDDKSYPYVKVTMAEDYPRVLITRRHIKDGSRYFGPYTDVGALHESLKLIKRLFPLRSCRRMADRPCLEYHIKRCLAPCQNKISVAEYLSMIQTVCLFLEGRTDVMEKELTAQMQAAAAEYKFEAAGRIRDRLLAIKKITEKQRIVTAAGDQDAIGLAVGDYGVCATVLVIRGGKMIGAEHFLLRNIEDESEENLLSAFLSQYYHQATSLPREVLMPVPVNDAELLGKWLSEQRGLKVQLIVPRRGDKFDVVNLAAENARKYLKESAEAKQMSEEGGIKAMEELGHYLHLTVPPRRMECFDISHNQGSETVASMVVFENGHPQKAAYRRFKIKSAEGKPDDFKSMREVTTRRYGKIAAEELPNLIVIDGGLGQLSSALSVIRGAGHHDVPVVGLAKQHELIFVEGSSEPIELPRHSQALYLIQRIRDEAHRFAITYHRKLRRKRNLTSVLDNIVGIGAKRRQLLWEHYGQLGKIKNATVDDLASIKGMTRESAQAVYNFFAAYR